ncbi:mechanosensitive ion channel family protein [Candidatus Odyssella thessalonicensis]|uniref:mechanosensitive ion channel family protein n=1 Tax=Candidatus Odyssella thessalonicensis TaxID=84647 RepID=UPI000225A8AF|nr:mechanosensitive ion channel family protein [Candidatus Odyssella thessalonicensis]
MNRIIYFALFISTIAGLGAGILYLIPNPDHLSWLKKGFEILLLTFSSWTLLRLLNRFIWPSLRENFQIRVSHLLIVIINIFIVVTLVFGITVGILDLEIDSILTTSGLVSAAVAIALQGLIIDVAASIIIDLDHLYKIGDWIKLDEVTEGRVISIGWRHTEILTLTQTHLIINNGRMLTTSIQNFGQAPRWAIDEVKIAVSHDIPSHRVKRIVETALQRHHCASQHYAEVLARTLDSGGVNYFVRYGINDQGRRWQIRHSVIDALRQELHSYGLRISEGLGEYGIFRGNQPLIEKEFSPPHDQILGSELFQGFSPEQIQRIITLSKPIFLPEGAIIVQKGNRDQTLYLIGEGTVELPLTDQEKRLLHSGDYFGEQGFLLGNPRTTDVIAKTNVLLYHYSKADLEPILRLRPETLTQMLGVMLRRSKDLKEALTAVKRTSPDETLEELIVKTVKEFFSLNTSL